MTLCLWYKFGSLAGASQTLFEMSNGYGTEHIYIRRLGDSSDLVFGVDHTSSLYKAEHRTLNGTGVARKGVGYWQHVCWVVQHALNASHVPGASAGAPYLLPESLFVWSSMPTSFAAASTLVASQAMAGYRARWSIYINGGQGDPFWAYENLEGVMPVEGSYAMNYIGYGTSFSGSFFSGSISDLRLYERPLDLASVRAIFSGAACCAVFSPGSYIDASAPCDAQGAYNSEFCRACKSDCRPFFFIENEDNACTGGRTRDFTLCQPCKPCAQDQFMNKTCSGTSFADEGTCPPCRYKSTDDCPAGQVMIGRCEGNQIYDTSLCIDCNAECVGADRDPQRRGQFIERVCSQSANDYVCKPCSALCPVGTFTSSLCTGKGRTDTGCSICRSFCAEALAGVPGAHGQYIEGVCDGSTSTDVQRCKPCKQCPEGHYPTNLCNGISFTDTVECIKCRTECPAGFYLQGDCRVEEVRCVPCDPPCANQSAFLQEKRGCAGGVNRLCEPTTKCKVSTVLCTARLCVSASHTCALQGKVSTVLCTARLCVSASHACALQDASCPPGYYESATCTDPNGPKFCAPCRVCSRGQYQSQLCTTQHNRECT